MERAQSRSVSALKLTICLTLLGVGALSLLNTARAEGPPQTVPDGPEKAIYIATCSGCHPAEAVLGHQNPPKYWDKEIEHMIDRGAKGKPEDFEKIAAYLKRNFSYVPGTVNLPDGPGKAELILAIDQYVDRHNEKPKPFIWTAKASDILEKVKRARITLNNVQSV